MDVQSIMLEKVDSLDLLMPPSIRNAPVIIYLLYVDDLLVFSEDNFQSATCIKKTISEFSSFLGLEAKAMKSFIFFSQVSPIMKYYLNLWFPCARALYLLFGSSFELTLMCNVFALIKLEPNFKDGCLVYYLMLVTFNS